MAKTAASTPKRGKTAAKTATSKTTSMKAATGKPDALKADAEKAPVAKSRSRTAKPPVEALLPHPALPDLEKLIAPLAAQLTALDEKITQSVSQLQADIQALSDGLHTIQQTQQLAQQPAQQVESGQSQGQPEGTPVSSSEPSETFLPVVADLLRRNLSEHLSPLTTTLRRLEERIGFVSNRLKPAPGGGGQDRQKQWRRDQQPHHFRSRGQGSSRPGQGGQGQGGQGGGGQGGQGQPWSPPSAASVQGHFAPRRFPGNGGDLQLEEED